MKIDAKVLKGSLLGLVFGVVWGGVMVHEFTPKPDVLIVNKSVNSETNKSVVNSIDYNHGKCSLSLKSFRFIGIIDDSVQLDGGYRCSLLDSKEDVYNLKKALDKAIELEWVK